MFITKSAVSSHLLVFALTMCLFGHALSQQYPPGFCTAQNPLIRMLKRHEVEIFDTPIAANSQTCVSEWGTHQTCCDAKSLVKYAEADIRKLNKDMKDVKNDVIKMSKWVKKNEEKIEKAIKKADMKDKKEFIEQLNKDWKSFKRELDSVLDNEKKAEDEKDDCFERIKDIRTSSLCFTCSGRSSQFFLKGLAKISMSDCRRTIDKCGDTWRKSIDLVDAIVLAKKIRKQLKEVIPKNELMDFEDNEIERFRNWIGSNHLRGPIKECDGKAKDCSNASAVLLCENFISLRKHGFMSELGDMIGQQHQAGQGQAQHAPPGHNNIWHVGTGRVLQNTGDSNHLTTGVAQSVSVVSNNASPMDTNGCVYEWKPCAKAPIDEY